MGLRLDGLPVMTLWDMVINVLEPFEETQIEKPQIKNVARVTTSDLLPAATQELRAVDYMLTRLIICLPMLINCRTDANWILWKTMMQ